MPRTTLAATRSFLTLMLTTTALALGLAAPASAHSELVAATPGDGETLAEAPAEVVLEFNEEIQDLGNEIVVVDAEGTPVATGDAVVDGVTVTQAITGGTAGTFTVTWRVVSEDGHPISGEYAYEVEESAAPTTEESATTETPEAATTEAPESESATAAEPESGGGAATPWLVAVAVAAAAGAVAMIVRRSRAR
jgi:methionine-rich copper-binding protein CopC